MGRACASQAMLDKMTALEAKAGTRVETSELLNACVVLKKGQSTRANSYSFNLENPTFRVRSFC